MKSSTLLSTTLLLGTALCASIFPTDALTKRDDCTAALPTSTYTSILSLVENLQTTTDAFNTSVATTHAAFTSSDGNTLTATTGYEAAVLSLTTAFTTTTSEIEALTGVATADVSSSCLNVTNTKRGELVQARQAANVTEIEAAIEAAVEAIIAEITTGIDTIKADLGLGKSCNHFPGFIDQYADFGFVDSALIFLEPLLLALGGLLIALVPVADGLLVAVGALLDVLLVGLGLTVVSIGLI